MKITTEGDWHVTDPVLTGDAAAVEKMRRCQHGVWKEQSRTAVTGAGGVYSVIERCEDCGAIRSRCRAATAQEIEEWERRRAQEKARRQAESP